MSVDLRGHGVTSIGSILEIRLIYESSCYCEQCHVVTEAVDVPSDNNFTTLFESGEAHSLMGG